MIGAIKSAFGGKRSGSTSAKCIPQSISALPPGRKATELGYAVRRGDLDKVELMLAAGTDPNAPDAHGWHPVNLCAAYDRPDILRVLLESGAGADLPLFEDNLTPLMTAAARCRLAVIELLVAAGASLSSRDRYGWTPLLHAAAGRHAKTAEAICMLAGAAGAKAKDRDGVTALMLSASNGDMSSVGLLIAAGANPKAVDADGRSAVDYAKKTRHADMHEIVGMLKAS